jgi:hypothetical protein
MIDARMDLPGGYVSGSFLCVTTRGGYVKIIRVSSEDCDMCGQLELLCEPESARGVASLLLASADKAEAHRETQA